MVSSDTSDGQRFVVVPRLTRLPGRADAPRKGYLIEGRSSRYGPCFFSGTNDVREDGARAIGVRAPPNLPKPHLRDG